MQKVNGLLKFRWLPKKWINEKLGLIKVFSWENMLVLTSNLSK